MGCAIVYLITMSPAHGRGYNREKIEHFSMKLMCWKRENGEQYDNINFDLCQIVVAGQQAVSSHTRGELLQQELL